MSLTDKVTGKVKQAAGDLTGDASLRREGTKEERKVGHDNTVAFNRLRLQIPESPLRPHYVRAIVKVRQYHDGSHAIFHGPRCLARYDCKGHPSVPPTQTNLAA